MALFAQSAEHVPEKAHQVFHAARAYLGLGVVGFSGRQRSQGLVQRQRAVAQLVVGEVQREQLGALGLRFLAGLRSSVPADLTAFQQYYAIPSVRPP